MPSILIVINAGLSAFLSIAGLIGNTLIIYAFAKIKRLRNINNIFLLQLAMVDLIKSTLILPVKAYAQLSEKNQIWSFYCQPSGFISTISFAHSALLLAAIAVVRYFKIVKSMRFETVFTRRRTVYYSCGILLATVALAILPIVGAGKYEYSKHHGVCFTTWTSQNIPFRSLLYVYTIGVTYPVLIYCYTRIFVKLRKHQRVAMLGARKSKQSIKMAKIDQSKITAGDKGSESGQLKGDNSMVGHRKDVETVSTASKIATSQQLKGDNSMVEHRKDVETVSTASKIATSPTAGDKEEDNQRDNKASTSRNEKKQKAKSPRAIQNEIRVTKVMFTVVITYSVCWLPAFIVTVLALCKTAAVSDGVLYLIVTLVDMKVFLNPLIYGLWNHQFRKGLKQLFISNYLPNRSTNSIGNSRPSNTSS